MKTKDRILDAALDLFNTQGSAPVSTNHIAEAAGISPGNLYYHFRNKEDIIRALFERLFARWDVAFALPDDTLPDLALVRDLVGENFRIMDQYRFVYREILALLRGDDALRARYIAIRQRGYDGFHAIFAALEFAGVVRTADAEARERLADLCWLISEFWLSALEVSGQPIDTGQIERGIDLMMSALAPYLQP